MCAAVGRAVSAGDLPGWALRCRLTQNESEYRAQLDFLERTSAATADVAAAVVAAAAEAAAIEPARPDGTVTRPSSIDGPDPCYPTGRRMNGLGATSENAPSRYESSRAPLWQLLLQAPTIQAHHWLRGWDKPGCRAFHLYAVFSIVLETYGLAGPGCCTSRVCYAYLLTPAKGAHLYTFDGLGSCQSN